MFYQNGDWNIESNIVLSTCLRQSASFWFETISENVKSWADFEEQFLLEYWNENIQRS